MFARTVTQTLTVDNDIAVKFYDIVHAAGLAVVGVAPQGQQIALTVSGKQSAYNLASVGFAAADIVIYL